MINHGDADDQEQRERNWPCIGTEDEMIDADALIAELETRAEACHRDFNRAKHKVDKDMLMEAHVGYIKLIGMVKARPTIDLETLNFFNYY